MWYAVVSVVIAQINCLRTFRPDITYDTLNAIEYVLFLFVICREILIWNGITHAKITQKCYMCVRYCLPSAATQVSHIRQTSTWRRAGNFVSKPMDRMSRRMLLLDRRKVVTWFIFKVLRVVVRFIFKLKRCKTLHTCTRCHISWIFRIT